MKNIILVFVFVFVSFSSFSQEALVTKQDSLFALDKGPITEKLLISLINKQLIVIQDSCLILNYDDFFTIIYDTKKIAVLCIVNYDSPYQELIFVTLFGNKKFVSNLSEIDVLEMWPTVILEGKLILEKDANLALKFFKGGGF